MREALSYSEHTELLTALVSYLALTRHKSRTPTGIARDLGLSEAEVVKVLDGFPGLFRKSKNTATRGSRKGQHFYTLHVRYAIRDIDDADEDDPEPREALPADYVVALFDVIGNRSSEERSEAHALKQNKITTIGVWIAAVAAVLAAVIAAIGQIFSGSQPL